MLFKQRFFSWFDSYDIYDESGCVLYTVRGQLSWGHCLKIFDAAGAEGQRPTLVYDSCFESGGYEKTPAGNTQREAF